MTLRSIEMQVAIPRTSEVGQIQNQLSQKPAYDQSLLAQQSAKQAEEKLKRSNEVDKAANLLVGDEDQKRDGQRDHHPNGEKNKEQSDRNKEAPMHPYKGRHIDLSL